MFRARLETTEVGFFELFHRQAVLVEEGAGVFLGILEAWPRSQEAVDRLDTLERQADEVGSAAIDLLHRTVVTPMGRDDILTLVTRIDAVLDTMNAAAQRMVVFEVEEIPPSLLDLARCLSQSAAQVTLLLDEMRSGADNVRIRARRDEIGRLENEGDRLLRTGLGRLFREQASNPLRIVKLKDIYEMVEVAVDQCKAVSNLVAGLLLPRP